MKRKAESPADIPYPVRVHPLLGLQIEETNHVLSKRGRAACEEDPDLEPGLNCCAVCASKPSGQLLECQQCHRVKYCNAAHQTADAKHHEKVCKLLEVLAAADAVEVDSDEVQQILDEFEPPNNTKALARATGWLDVAPDRFKGVLGAEVRGGSAGAAKRARSRKAGSTQEEAQGQDPATPTRAARAETNNEDATTPMETSSTPGVLPHLSPTEPSSAGKARGEEATTAGGSEAGPSTAEHVADGTAEIRDSELVTAVHMAVASSYLSYPYTLAHTIASNASCAEVVAQAAAAGRAVVVTMLGASETAELAHMSCWQAVAAVCASGVVLQCVGPEVPDHLHLTHTPLGAGDASKAVFFQGEYQDLVAQVLPSQGGETAPAKTDGLGEGDTPQLLTLLPDIVVGYNMGITCPDYSWSPTLDALRTVFRAKCSSPPVDASTSSGAGRGRVRLPWVVTANTHVESMMEEEVVRDGGWGVSAGIDRNPFTALEPIQSGTLANDLYRKNAWMAVYELVRAPLGPVSGGRRRGQARSLRQRIGGLVGRVVGSLPRVPLPWGRRRG